MSSSQNRIAAPRVYRQCLQPSSSEDQDDRASMASTLSWRTFRSISAPSSLLSYKRGNLGSLVGRGLNRFGEIALAPYENFLIRRELEGLIKYLDDIETPEEWGKVIAMMEKPLLADRILEPLRPMYPTSVRVLAHEVIHVIMMRGRFNLSNVNLLCHFHSRNEYSLCISDHVKFLQSIYPLFLTKQLLDQLHPESDFLVDLKEVLSGGQTSSSNFWIPSISSSSRAIIRLSLLRGALVPSSMPNTYLTMHDLLRQTSRRRGNSIDLKERSAAIRQLMSCLAYVDNVVTDTASHIMERMAPVTVHMKGFNKSPLMI